jgi:hypothetical protein
MRKKISNEMINKSNALFSYWYRLDSKSKIIDEHIGVGEHLMNIIMKSNVNIYLWCFLFSENLAAL